MLHLSLEGTTIGRTCYRPVTPMHYRQAIIYHSLVSSTPTETITRINFPACYYYTYWVLLSQSKPKSGAKLKREIKNYNYYGKLCRYLKIIFAKKTFQIFHSYFIYDMNKKLNSHVDLYDNT